MIQGDKLSIEFEIRGDILSQTLLILSAPWYWSLSIAEEQSLPPDRQSNCIRYVMIYTPHELWYSYLCIFEPLHLHQTFKTIWWTMYIHIFWCTYFFWSTYFFQAWYDWKNNHLCTTPACPCSPICYVPGIFEGLNPFYTGKYVRKWNSTKKPPRIQMAIGLKNTMRVNQWQKCEQIL